jgi:hypothetical protein
MRQGTGGQEDESHSLFEPSEHFLFSLGHLRPNNSIKQSQCILILILNPQPNNPIIDQDQAFRRLGFVSFGFRVTLSKRRRRTMTTTTTPYSSTRCRLHCRASPSETARTARRVRAPSGAQPLASCRICAALRKEAISASLSANPSPALTQRPNTCAEPAWRRCMHLGTAQVGQCASRAS